MFELASLQEAYTGALIAGKGKSLNNINIIMERMRFKNEAWVRVRFGAGVPWRRCWCVITPPDEKEYQKLQKELKKRSPYDRSHVPILKGDIKFYDNKKEGKRQKKARPIATITDAYSAYAIYPQAKSLIDASTLLKIEGNITIHTDPPSSTEGFVFIMPEAHPAVSGFEMLLRFLFPAWDTFGLYGRPGRLVASTLDPRSLMFAMPKHRRYGYLDVLDVSQLIAIDGSRAWTEREWRKRLKDLTGQRMNEWDESEKTHNRNSSRRSNRLSFGMGANGDSPPKPRAVGFADDAASVRSAGSFSPNQYPPPHGGPMIPSDFEVPFGHHARNSSDPQPGSGAAFAPPVMSMPFSNNSTGHVLQNSRVDGAHYDQSVMSRDTTSSSDDDHGSRNTPVRELEGMRQMNTPEPVSQPPALNHGPNARPAGGKPFHSPEQRRANSRLSNTTLSQLVKAGGLDYASEKSLQDGPFRGNGEGIAEHRQLVHSNINPVVDPANQDRSREAMISSPMSPPGANLDSNRPQPPPHMIPPYQEPRRSTESYDDGRSNPPGRFGPGGNFESNPPPNAPPLEPPMQRPYAGHYRPSTPPTRDPAGRSGPPQGRSGLHNEMVPPINTSPPFHRKPVPDRVEAVHAETNVSPQSASSSESFRGNMIDPAILDQIRTQDVADENSPRLQQGPYHQDSFRSEDSSSHYTGTRAHNTPQIPSGNLPFRGPPTNVQRQNSSKSSQYSDADSTTSPDYASTRKSSETAASVERPRAGVLRTVGGGDAPPMPTRGDEYDIPSIDFGPTVGYDMQRRKAAAESPPPQQQRPPFAHIHRKSPSGERGHSRQESNDTIRRSVVWQPGAAVAGNSGQGLSVEEFVQQRAAAAAAPVISHARTPSGNTLGPGRSVTPTPSMTRTISGDVLAQRHSRASSADLLQRPGSRGAGATLGFGSAGEMSSNLSARELEHVARVTGSPLISMAGNKPTQQGTGLVGAIEARERERQQIKHGVNSQAVQHAINQRQQQQQQQRYQQQSVNIPPPQGMYQGMGFGPSPQQAWQPQFQQQPYVYGGGPGNMGPPMMAGPFPPQGAGGYSRPPGPRVPTGRQSPAPLDPRMMGPPPGPYGGGAPAQQGGRGYMYQGQAF